MQAFPLWPVMCNTVFSLACSEGQQFKVSFAWNGCNQLIEISSGVTVLISFALRIMNPASCVSEFLVLRISFLNFFFFSFQERKLTLLTPLPSSSSHSSQTSGAGRCGNLLCSCIMIWLFLNRCCDTTFLTTQLFSRFFFFLTLSSLQRHWDETQTTLIRKK